MFFLLEYDCIMNENDSIAAITTLYEKILKRKPDKTSLYYFVSNLEKKYLSLEDVKEILSDSDEAKSLSDYSHYADKYWNDLEVVRKYKNKLATGNENTHWIEDILERFKEHLPFEDVLIVGCGNGWLERKLFDLGIGKHFDAFDMSVKYIDEVLDIALQEKVADFSAE